MVASELGVQSLTDEVCLSALCWQGKGPPPSLSWRLGHVVLMGGLGGSVLLFEPDSEQDPV